MKIFCLLIILSFAPACAEDWTVAGKTYHNVVVGSVFPDRVEITYDGGVGTPLLKDLSPDLQKRFGYVPAKAKAESDARAIALAEAEKRVRADAAVIARQEAMDKHEASYAVTKGPLHLTALVRQNTEDGCYVVCCAKPASTDGSDSLSTSDTSLIRDLAASGTDGTTSASASAPTQSTPGYGQAHHDRNSMFDSSNGAAVAIPPPLIPDGIYFLSGATFTIHQSLNVIVYEVKPVWGADGNLYRHFTTDKSEVAP